MNNFSWTLTSIERKGGAKELEQVAKEKRKVNDFYR
jgi:hypothetical protein